MTRAPSFALAAAAALVATTACKSKAPAAAPPPTSRDAGPAAVDAAAALDADLPEPASLDEATLRAGKRTGLGAADERPEVATEEFVTALLDGRQPWARVVDDRFGVVELRTLDGDSKPVAAVMGRQCGAAVAPALARLAKTTTAALAATALGYRLACDNSGLASPGGGVAVATCAVDADADGALAFDLLLVPDAALGLRLIGITLLDATLPPVELADAFDVELGRTDARCP